MMNKLSQGILIQQEKEIIYSNSALKLLLSIETDTEIPDAISRISHNNTNLSSILASCETSTDFEQENFCIHHKDTEGQDKRWSVEIRKIHFDGKNSIALVLEDLTLSMQMERQVLNKKFEKIFFASFTHEIITPINGIIGLIEILKEETISEEMERLIETAKRTCQLLLYLVNDIAGFSISQSDDKTHPANDWASIREVISEVEQLYIFSFNRKQIALRIDVSQDVPELMYIDRVKYRQIIIHLLGNALKYTMEGYVKINITYDKNMLYTSVIDTGIGMGKNDVDSLFKLFGKLHLFNENELNPQGIGLGLAICYKYSKIMNGKLLVKSELGIGTEFTLVIPNDDEKYRENMKITSTREPCLTNEDVEERIPSRKPYQTMKSTISDQLRKMSSINNIDENNIIFMKKCDCKRFLIVDDNDLNRFAMQGLLKKYGECSEEVFF